MIDRETAGLLLSDYVDADARTAALASVADGPDRSRVLRAIAEDITQRLNVATHLGTKFSDRAIALHGVQTQLAAAQATGTAADLYAVLAGRPAESGEPFPRGWLDALAAITSRTEPLSFGHQPGT